MKERQKENPDPEKLLKEFENCEVPEKCVICRKMVKILWHEKIDNSDEENK